MVNYYHNKSIAQTILQEEWNMKKLTAFVLSAMMVLSLAACGAKTETPADTSTPAADATKPAEVAKLTYAVEAGSAGEEVALANGYNVVSVDSQAKALMEVQAGTADAAIIDSLMAGAMVGEGTSYPDLTITDQKLTEELYGVGCRKGSDLASFINSVMADAYADGVLEATAETYGVQAALVEQPASEFTASESDSDVQYIKDKGTLVIGITDFAQDQLGEILFVDLPDAGASFGADDEFGTVESLKTVSSLYMPVAGEVVERNEALEGKPTLVNLNCYADGWMLRIRPTETPALMTAADYRSQLEG